MKKLTWGMFVKSCDGKAILGYGVVGLIALIILISSAALSIPLPCLACFIGPALILLVCISPFIVLPYAMKAGVKSTCTSNVLTNYFKNR